MYKERFTSLKEKSLSKSKLPITQGDPFKVINRSRNKIVSFTQSEKIPCYSNTPQAHFIMMDTKRKRRAKSPTKQLNKLMIPNSELIALTRKDHYSKSQEGKRRKMEEILFLEKRRRSLDNVKDKKIRIIVEDLKKRKIREREMDKILDRIITENTTFEDILTPQLQDGRHRQIISTIPPGILFPTIKPDNVPSLMTGRFNVPEEEVKEPISVLEPFHTVNDPELVPTTAIELSIPSVNIYSDHKVTLNIVIEFVMVLLQNEQM